MRRFAAPGLKTEMASLATTVEVETHSGCADSMSAMNAMAGRVREIYAEIFVHDTDLAVLRALTDNQVLALALGDIAAVSGSR